MLGIQNATIHHNPNASDDKAEATVTTTRKVISQILGGQKSLNEALEEGDFAIKGNQLVGKVFFDSLESFVTAPLIEPK